MRHALALIVVLALPGCGSEVATTAAVVGATQAQNAQDARKQLDNVNQKLDAAERQIQQRAAAADGQQ